MPGQLNSQAIMQMLQQQMQGGGGGPQGSPGLPPNSNAPQDMQGMMSQMNGSPGMVQGGGQQTESPVGGASPIPMAQGIPPEMVTVAMRLAQQMAGLPPEAVDLAMRLKMLFGGQQASPENTPNSNMPSGVGGQDMSSGGGAVGPSQYPGMTQQVNDSGYSQNFPSPGGGGIGGQGGISDVARRYLSGMLTQGPDNDNNY